MVLLGNQLIRDAGIAVFELVKNAYDADATECSVTLENIDHEAGAAIVVEDNGSGMDLATVTGQWLRPGTANRLQQRQKALAGPSRTRRFARLPLGEKGVGRFAAHKLGNLVTMTTRAADQQEVVVQVDWQTFEEDRPLSEVMIDVSTRKPEVFTGTQTGTRIRIENLRDVPWTRRRVRSLHRAITAICSTNEGPASFEAKMTLEPDPGGWLKGLLTLDAVRKQALFRFQGRIENDTLTYTYAFRPGAGLDRVSPRAVRDRSIPLPPVNLDSIEHEGMLVQDRTEPAAIPLSQRKIGPIGLHFDIFDLDRQTLTMLQADTAGLKDFLANNGGVKVFRDGVRVYDFGEAGNDWLDLGGRRVNVPTRRIGNNQIIGEVHLKLAKSADLIEKTNREGFVENDAYHQFRAAVAFAVTQAEFERNRDKDQIRKAYAKAKDKEPVVEDLGRLRGEIETVKLPSEDTTRLLRYVDQIDRQYREVLDRLLVAAGPGLNLAIVMHEVEKGIGQLYKAVSGEAPHKQVLALAKHLAEVVDSISWMLRQSGKTDVTAKALIENLAFAWSARFDRHKVELVNGLEHGDSDFTVRCARRLVMSALMNLVDNAFYWVTVKGRHPKIYIGTTKEATGRPAIVVADTGPGFVDPPEYLTAPFFTRKPGGMGLGLHLASEIMRSQGGRVIFPDPGDVELPKEFDGAVVLLAFGTKE
jgi:signal transduction histidine kinase